MGSKKSFPLLLLLFFFISRNERNKHLDQNTTKGISIDQVWSILWESLPTPFLTHFSLVSHFYTPWNSGFLNHLIERLSLMIVFGMKEFVIHGKQYVSNLKHMSYVRVDIHNQYVLVPANH